MATLNLTKVPYNPDPSQATKNLTGQSFGRLLAIGIYGRWKMKTHWLCRCSCGGFAVIPTAKLTTSLTRNCGCLKAQLIGASHTKHGESKGGKITPELRAYRAAKKRCDNPNYKNYHRYGGRGIEVRFKDFAEFLDALGRRPSPEHSLDRFPDPNGHYEKGNVRWATQTQQMRNLENSPRITVDGISRGMADWADISSLTSQIIYKRLKRGWCNRCAVSNKSGESCVHSFR